MPADLTTFLAAFLALFALLGGYLAHLERRARRLEERLARLEAPSASKKNGPGPGRPGP